MLTIEHASEPLHMRVGRPFSRVAFALATEAAAARLAKEPFIGPAFSAPDERVANNLKMPVPDGGSCVKEILEDLCPRVHC